MPSITELQKIASQCRRDVLRMTHAVASGHPGGSLSSTDILVALYFDILKHNPKKFTKQAKDEDVFILSIGHISPILYSILARSGYFDIKELSTFRKLNTRLQGHPATTENLPGIHIATGSLGQGLSASIGIALAKKANNDPQQVFCLMGDGEIQEGQVWEAAMYAGAHKIDNLIGIIDNNGQQIDGPIEKIMPSSNLKNKWEAFNWQVLEMQGNDMSDVVKTITQAKTLCGNGKPIMILAHTQMGFGVDFMTGTNKWHGTPLNDEQLAKALPQLEETLGDY